MRSGTPSCLMLYVTDANQLKKEKERKKKTGENFWHIDRRREKRNRFSKLIGQQCIKYFQLILNSSFLLLSCHY